MPGAKRALISVHDKRGVEEFARRLAALGYTILSTGGTASTLQKAGVPVTEVSAYTGHPEILGGRVKTLHPRVHGGLLADPSQPGHRADLERTGIEPIALLAVNLYPFREVASRAAAALDEVIEMIDIGGPAMVRSAAKNHRNVAVIVDPADYEAVLGEMEKSGDLAEVTRKALAVKAFGHTAGYDAAIHDELSRRFATAPADFPARLSLSFTLLHPLRYGENPHQRAALYADPDAGAGAVASARKIQGKELSYNNILDLDAAWRLVLEFDQPAAAVIKHNNPCGVATGASLQEAFDKARRTDEISSFGGIVSFNREMDEAAAASVTSLFLECVIAPGYAPAAREILAAKTGLRVLQAAPDPASAYRGFDLRRVTGGLLVQDWDRAATDMGHARVASMRPPTAEEMRALDFAWRVARHVKSNAIVLARADRTIGIGAGQMSRVDSVRLACMKAPEPTAGTVMASDAFFPFRDGLDEAARAGITAVVQPGGSMRDSEVIAAADEHGLAMLFTGVRHFRH